MQTLNILIKQAVNVLKNQGIILSPTDTVPGLSCNIFYKNALDKINLLKKRTQEKKYILLFYSIEKVKKHFYLKPEEQKIIYEAIETPTTFIFPNRNTSDIPHLREQKTIAIRLVKTGIISHILKKIDYPLVSTSANISGKKTPLNIKQVDGIVKNKVDLILLDLDSENTQSSKASRIIKLENNKKILIRS